MSGQDIDDIIAMLEIGESLPEGHWYQDERLSLVVPHLDQYRVYKRHDDGFLVLHAMYALPEDLQRADCAGWSEEYKIRPYIGRSRFRILKFLKERYDGPPAPVVEGDGGDDADEDEDDGEDTVDGSQGRLA